MHTLYILNLAVETELNPFFFFLRLICLFANACNADLLEKVSWKVEKNKRAAWSECTFVCGISRELRISTRAKEISTFSTSSWPAPMFIFWVSTGRRHCIDKGILIHSMFVCVVAFFFSCVESLKLQRNTENYLYLRNTHVAQVRGWPSDKEDFVSTRVGCLWIGLSCKLSWNCSNRVLYCQLKSG